MAVSQKEPAVPLGLGGSGGSQLFLTMHLVDSCDDEGHFVSSEVGERSLSQQECCSLPYSVGDSPHHRGDSVSA